MLVDYLDKVNFDNLHGWVYDTELGALSVYICVYINGSLYTCMEANEKRPDIVVHPDVDDPDHGFSINVDLGYGDQVNVYALVYDIVGSMQELAGSPVILEELPNKSPIGYLDVITSNSAKGWAYDSDVGASYVDVHLYDGSKIIGMVKANQKRDDLTPVVGDPNHGFYYKFPQLSAGEHTIHAYAINCPKGNNPELSGSPKTITSIGKPVLVEKEGTGHFGYFCAAKVWGTQLWTGTYSASQTSRLYRYFPEEVLIDLETGESIYHICPCHDQRVLIGCEDGYLYLYDGTGFKEVLKKHKGVYAMIDDPNTGYTYAAFTRNDEPKVVEIYRSKDKLNWSKVYSKDHSQLKAGCLCHGVPQFFGYDFNSCMGFRVWTTDNGQTWNKQNLQSKTRYLDAFSDPTNYEVCWLGTCYNKDAKKGSHSPSDSSAQAGIAKLTSTGITQVLSASGGVGMTIKRSPIDGYLYFGELNWKSKTKKAQIWRSLSGEAGTWEVVITTTEPEITDQVFIDGKHYWFTKNHVSHGKLFELIWT